MLQTIDLRIPGNRIRTNSFAYPVVWDHLRWRVWRPDKTPHLSRHVYKNYSKALAAADRINASLGIRVKTYHFIREDRSVVYAEQGSQVSMGGMHYNWLVCAHCHQGNLVSDETPGFVCLACHEWTSLEG